MRQLIAALDLRERIEQLHAEAMMIRDAASWLSTHVNRLARRSPEDSSRWLVTGLGDVDEGTMLAEAVRCGFVPYDAHG